MSKLKLVKEATDGNQDIKKPVNPSQEVVQGFMKIVSGEIDRRRINPDVMRLVPPQHSPEKRKKA